jgi:hypothetical protein
VTQTPFLKPPLFTFSQHKRSVFFLLFFVVLATLHSFKTAALLLQIKHKAFPFLEAIKICASTSEKFYIRSPLYVFFIKTLYRVFLCNSSHSSLIVDNRKQLILEKRTGYVHKVH